MPRKKDYWDRKMEDPAFREQLRSWDLKLKEAGFLDIEQRYETRGKDAMYLTGGPSSGDLSRNLYQESKEDYYRLARQHYWTMKPGLPRHIWKLHSEGASTAKITRWLKPHYKLSKGKVERAVKRERDKMFKRMNREADVAYLPEDWDGE